MSSIPWTFEPRSDTRFTNIRLGTWLFLSSEAMFFASMFFAFVLLRTNAEAWPDARSLLSGERIVGLTVLLVLATRFVGKRDALTIFFAALFLIDKVAHDVQLWSAGTRPSVNLMVALWYVLTGLHGLHVAGGVIATAWFAAFSKGVPVPHQTERQRALRLYWWFVDVVWVGIVLCFR